MMTDTQFLTTTTRGNKITDEASSVYLKGINIRFKSSTLFIALLI